MLNVLFTKPFPDELLDRVRAAVPDISVSRAEPDAADYANADVLYCDSLPRPEQAPNLKWVQLHLAGVNSIIEHPFYTDGKVVLTTLSGIHATTASEYAFAAILALTRHVPAMVEWQKRGHWPPDDQRWSLFVPTLLRGATLGIVGYGSIGREIARVGKTAFGMRVLACKRDVSAKEDTGYRLPGTGDADGSLPDAWFAPSQVRYLMAQSDVVVLCAPLTPETYRLLDAAAIAAMSSTTYFVNVGRGACLDEEALADALAARRIAGAALDVFQEEPLPAGHRFYGLDNAIVSPHVSGFTPVYDGQCSDLFIANLRRFLAGEPMFNLVDRAKGY